MWLYNMGNKLINAIVLALVIVGFTATAREIPRLQESELTNEIFLKFVSLGRPLIVVRDDGEGGEAGSYSNNVVHVDSGTTCIEASNIQSPKNILTSLLEECGDMPVQLLSPTVETFLGNLPSYQTFWLDSLVRLAFGIRLGDWVKERESVRLREFYENSRACGNKKNSSSKSGSARFFIPKFAMTLLNIIGRPPYLADISVDIVCPSVLSKILPSKFEEHILQKVLAKNYFDHEIYSEHIHDSTEKFFWGGAETSSYPLHRDNNDADAVFDVLSGCKEFIIVHPDERDKLSRLDVVGFNIWQDDLFENTPEWAWRGLVRENEMIFMPGDYLHEVRNNCADTIAVCRRPWRASAVRDIFDGEMGGVRKLYEESTYEELVKKNWIYWLCDIIGGFLGGVRMETEEREEHVHVFVQHQPPPPTMCRLTIK